MALNLTRSLGCLVGAFTLAFVSVSALAQDDISIPAEYSKQIQSRGAIEPLGDDIFGEQVSLYTGALEFVQNDVELPGNNALRVMVGRRFRPLQSLPTSTGNFADWNLEIPHLHGVFAGIGWVVPQYTNQRCSHFSAPPVTRSIQNDADFSAVEYWQGHFSYMPGRGDSEMLQRSGDSRIAIPGDSQSYSSYPVNSKDGTVFRCIPTDTGAGEGFEAALPDGTRITFNHVVSVPYAKLKKGSPGAEPLAAGTEGGDITPMFAPEYMLNRQEVWILPTLIRDHFGNTVQYVWNASVPRRLERIEASDGRQLHFEYKDSTTIRIWKVSDRPLTQSPRRTWEYVYTGENLTKVIEPDTTRSWTFDLARIRFLYEYIEADACGSGGTPMYGPEKGTIIHPDGVTGEFTISPWTMGRSWVMKDCGTGYDRHPVFSVNATLQSKKYTGLGLAAGGLSRAYVYSAPAGCYDPASLGGAGGGCTTSSATTRTTTVTESPSAIATRYTFGNRYRKTEGQLQQVDKGWNGTSAVRTTTTIYNTPGPSYVYPHYVGSSPQGGGDSFLNTCNTPRKKTTITVAGTSYTNVVGTEASVNAANQDNGFDEKARPLSVTRSGPPGSRADTRTYFDNLTHFVLGNVDTRTNTNTGLVELDIDYDTYSQPTVVRAFGRVRQSASYHPQGMLWKTWVSTVARATEYTDWNRGVPQTITFPDDSSDPNPYTSATVGNEGWIASVTDERGFTTSYGYDFNGRLASEIYPTAEPWLPRKIAYTRLTSPELNASTGAFRSRETYGNSAEGRRQVTTYYDALLRQTLVEDKDTQTGLAIYTKKSYTPATRRTFTSYPLANYSDNKGIISEYDALGRLWKQYTANDGVTALVTVKTIEYLGGNAIRVTDAVGNSTTTTYQAFGEPSYESATRIDAPINGSETQRTEIARDLFGKMTSATQYGLGSPLFAATAARTYLYDSVDQRLCGRVDPESGLTVWGYNDDNEVAWEAAGQSSSTCPTSAPGAATHFSYFPRGNKWKDDFSGTADDVTYGYDAGLNLTSVANAASVWTYDYNSRDLPKYELLSAGGLNFRLSYSYNTEAKRQQLTYPSNRSLPLLPDAFGRSTAVGSYATGVSYHPSGLVTGFNYGNGVRYEMTPDERQRPWEVKVISGSSTWMHLKQTYFNNNNVEKIEDYGPTNTGGADTRVLSYDGLNRLRTASGVWGSYEYKYNSLNNIRERVGGAGTVVYGYEAPTNRLKTVSGGGISRNYIYDNNVIGEGQVTSDGTGKSFTWSEIGRIKAISGAGTYDYDGHGRRFKTTNPGGGAEYTIYSSAGTMLYSYKPANGEFVDYVYLAGMPVAELKSIPDPPNYSLSTFLSNNVLQLQSLLENPTVKQLLSNAPSLPPQVVETVNSATGNNQQTATTTITYSHADLLNSPTQWSGSTGVHLDTEQYNPYGVKLNGVNEKLGYTAHVFDAASNLTYMQARFYDPLVGRFLSTDPVGFQDNSPFTFNRYSYANNNPYRYTDPNGEAVETPWDIANVAMGVASFGTNVAAGNVVGAAVDAVGVVIDVAASATPAVPGGAATAIKAVRGANKAREVLQANKAAGKAGEAATRAKLGDSIAGEKVMFETSDGTRTVPDFVTKDSGGFSVVETKTGNGQLTGGQQKLFGDVAAGKQVTPVGQNAGNAGLPSGTPVQLKSCSVDRHC